MAKAEYRSAIRSRRLINAALADLLLEKPLDKITVTDVVRRADINRGTFYAHYADIPDVMNHLIQQTFSRIRDVLADQPLTLSELPGMLLAEIQSILSEDLPFYRKLLTSGAASMLHEQLVGIIVEYLLSREADFSLGTHEQYMMTIRFCAGGLSNLYRDWFAGILPVTLDEMNHQAEQLLTRIITAPPA